MKNILTRFFSLFICLGAVIAAHGAEVVMPVLRISYEGKVNYDEYIPGEMQLTEADGSVVSLPAIFKTRGATALTYGMKPSLNMKLREADGTEIDYNLLDIRKSSTFILDAMAIDRICMRNRVCFDIWNDFYRLPYSTDFDSRDGTKGKFVEVYINDEYKGIYCLSDKINRKLLNLKKPKVDAATGEVEIRGVLYKQGTNDISNQNDPGFYNDYTVYVVGWHNAWELHEPDDYPSPAAWQPLLDFYADGNSLNYNYIREHFYLDNLVDYTLHLMALCIADNWGNKNKYMSQQNWQESGDASRFIVTPWDLDTSLGGEYDGSKYDGDYKDWSPEDIMKNGVAPFSACLGQQEFKSLLRQRWIETRNGVFAVDAVAARMYDYCNYFVESGAWQRYVDYWSTQRYHPLFVTDLPKEIGLIVKWYADRHDILDEYFGVTPEENGVADITSDSDIDAPVFNLQGIRVSDTSVPGIYIRNGKKFVVK